MLVDSHCHLDDPSFAAELEAVIGRAEAAGIGCMVTISTAVRNFPDILAIALSHERIYCSVGRNSHGHLGRCLWNWRRLEFGG